MRSQVTATVRSCFAALRQLRSVRRYLPQQALLRLIRALIISKVDYCCSVLVGVSGHLLDRVTDFSLSSTPPHGLSSQRGVLNASRRSCAISTGCASQSGYGSASVFSRSAVSTAQLRLTSLTVSVRRSTLGDRSFSVASPREWNSLPSAVRAASSLTTFRRELTTFLYYSSFLDH